MSQLFVDEIYNKEGLGNPTLPVGVKVVGVSTLLGSQTELNVSGVSTFAGVTNVSGILNASSDVRITGNINACISTLTGKAIVGSVTLQHSDIVAGVITATSYKGDGADLTGLPAGFSWIEGNLF